MKDFELTGHGRFFVGGGQPFDDGGLPARVYKQRGAERLRQALGGDDWAAVEAAARAWRYSTLGSRYEGNTVMVGQPPTYAVLAIQRFV